MSSDTTALLGSLMATIGCLVAVLGLIAGAPLALVAAGSITSIGGAVLVNRATRSNR
jgi:hypothetical protein